MNRTIRNLVIAVPLATVGLTMANTAAATAGPNGPVIIGQPKDKPEPHPGPKFDNDLPLKDAPKPQGPKDEAPKPQPKPSKPAVQPQAQAVTTPKAEKLVVKTAEVISSKGSPDSLDRADGLFVAEPKLVADTTDDGGLDLTWLLVGGGIVTASGIAFAARKRKSSWN